MFTLASGLAQVRGLSAASEEETQCETNDGYAGRGEPWILVHILIGGIGSLAGEFDGSLVPLRRIRGSLFFRKWPGL